MKYIKTVIIMLTALSFVSCATIVSKSNYPVNITSTPENTKFSIVNKTGKKIYSGVTPTVVNLKSGAGYFKGEQYTLLFKNPDCIPYEANLNAGFDGWYIGNIIFGGLIGMLIVDPLTGSMYRLDDLHVNLINHSSSTFKTKPMTTQPSTDEIDVWAKDDDA